MEDNVSLYEPSKLSLPRPKTLGDKTAKICDSLMKNLQITSVSPLLEITHEPDDYYKDQRIILNAIKNLVAKLKKKRPDIECLSNTEDRISFDRITYINAMFVIQRIHELLLKNKSCKKLAGKVRTDMKLFIADFANRLNNDCILQVKINRVQHQNSKKNKRHVKLEIIYNNKEMPQLLSKAFFSKSSIKVLSQSNLFTDGKCTINKCATDNKNFGYEVNKIISAITSTDFYRPSIQPKKYNLKQNYGHKLRQINTICKIFQEENIGIQNVTESLISMI